MVAIALTVFASACVTLPGSAIDNAILARTHFFDPGTVPSELVETLRPHRLILLGESHYVQAHQDFVVLLLREFHPHGLRAFNATLPQSQRIRSCYIDMNHNETAFQTSLQMMNIETDLSPVAAAVGAILALEMSGSTGCGRPWRSRFAVSRCGRIGMSRRGNRS